MPLLLCWLQILVGLEFWQSIQIVVHTVWELHLWTKGMSEVITLLWVAIGPCWQFFSLFCWQFLITFDPFPLYIADIFYGWPLREELGEASPPVDLYCFFEISIRTEKKFQLELKKKFSNKLTELFFSVLTEKKIQLVYNWNFFSVLTEFFFFSSNGYFKKPVEINRGSA